MEMTKSFGAYKRVCMIGIDGMGAFNRMANTPVMDALFANGATTDEALASRPTSSGECWGSMLTGAIPAVHGLSNSSLHPVEGLPTFFGIVREAMPDAETAAFTGWGAIANSIISPTGGAGYLDSGEDNALTERLLTYLDDHDPKLLFVQFDSVDGAGHACGYGSKGHLAQIERMDVLIGKIVATYKKRGFFEDTLFIVSADHGGNFLGDHGDHGGWSAVEREVFLGVAGKTVRPGRIGTVCLRDYPAIVLWALGISAPRFDPKGYAAQLPLGIFEDGGIADREELFAEVNGFDPKSEPAVGSAGHIDRFIPPDKVLMRINFENGFEDVTGKCRVELVSGGIKYYEMGVRGRCGEFGQCVLKVTGLPTPPVFTLMTWRLVGRNEYGWMDLFSTRDDLHRSFSLATGDDAMGIYLKEPDQSQTLAYLFAADKTEYSGSAKWHNYMVSVNTLENTLTCYTDFIIDRVIHVEDVPVSDYFDLSRLRLGLEQSPAGILRMMDDVAVLDGVPDLEALKHYYA